MRANNINIRIISADLDLRRGQWRIGQEVDDGSGQPVRHLHLIPPRAMIRHAAEYGLDPADSRAVLDWLLHERFVRYPDPTDPGPHCPYRNSPADAWAAHQSNVDKVKSVVSITDPDGHLEKIHRAHTPHPVQIIEAMDQVDRDRDHVQHTDRSRHRG